MPTFLLQLIRDLHTGTTARVRTPQGMSDVFYAAFPLRMHAVYAGKKSPFSRTAAHIFVSTGDAPATITQYVAWMKKQFSACQTTRSRYLSIFNTFRVIRCLSQCVRTKKNAILPHFCFHWGHPWGNHAKCCVDGK